jgi:hypothetical protein
LELSTSTRTNQVKSWMETLPPHFALAKFRKNDNLNIKRLQVLYFPGEGDVALEPQRKIIRYLNSSLKKVQIDEYDEKILNAYVDKSPVIVDGNSYAAFNIENIASSIKEFRLDNKDDLSNDDIILNFGTPRKMIATKNIILSNESRENILAIAKNNEQSCCASLIISATKLFRNQGGKVSAWVYSKNRIYKTYKDHFNEFCVVCEDMSSICQKISELKNNIINKKNSNELIVLLGIEQICNDFELIDFSNISVNVKQDYKEFEADSDINEKQVNEVIDINKLFRKKYNIEELEDDMMSMGKSLEEITEEEERLFDEFQTKYFSGLEFTDAKNDDTYSTSSVENIKKDESNIILEDFSYNAIEDFRYVVRQGSRFGYHFMLCLNDLSDIKSTKLQQDLFRHKLSFQVSSDDSITLFSSKVATRLPEHICQYSNSLEQFSFRPFIHKGVSWDGWEIDKNGNAINSNI